MDENGELQTDNKIKAELLNKFFQSVFTIEDTTQGIPIFPPSDSIWFIRLSLTNFSIDLCIMDVKLIGR
jgi:hypothetical protein